MKRMIKTKPDPRSNARQRSQADTRTRLLAAAAQLFAEYGGQKTTITAMARQAGVATGTVYLHFPDKESLLKEVLQTALAELKQSLSGAASERTARNLDEDVRQRTDGLVGFAAEHPHLAAVLFEPAILGTSAGDEVLEFLVASQQASLEAAMSKGWLRAELDGQLAARALVGSMLQVLAWWVGRTLAGDGGVPERQQVAAQLADLRLYGTSARGRD